jgi:hypothetical protein
LIPDKIVEQGDPDRVLTELGGQKGTMVYQRRSGAVVAAAGILGIAPAAVAALSNSYLSKRAEGQPS